MSKLKTNHVAPVFTYGPGTPVAIYDRLSEAKATEQATVDATERQADTTEAEAERRGWVVVARFTDVESAYDLTAVRPGFEAMLAEAETGAFHAIIGWSLDRLTCSQRDTGRLAELRTKHGVATVTVNGEADFATASGTAMAEVITAFARMERRRKGERQKLAYAQARDREGGAKPHWSTRPFGFNTDGTHKATEASLLREAYERFLAGDSCPSIAAWLNELGVRTTRGGQWSGSAVRTLLARERNGGMVTSEADGITRQGAWVAIVPMEWVRQVRASIKPGRPNGAGRAHEYLAARHIRCVCGAAMSTQSHREGSKPTRYVCNVRQTLDACGSVAIRQDFVDGLVTAAMLALLSDPETRATMVAHDHGASTADIQAELDQVAEAIAGIADMMGEGLLPAKVAKPKLVALQGQSATLMARLSRTAPPVVAHLAELATAEGRGATVGDWWASMPHPTKQALVRGLLEPVVIRKAERVGRPRLDPERVVVKPQEWAVTAT